MKQKTITLTEDRLRELRDMKRKAFEKAVKAIKADPIQKNVEVDG